MAEARTWKVTERLVDDTRRARVSIAAVDLPDGTHFEQWLYRLPTAAIVIVVNDADEVLMLWRHRFVIDQWVWELPGGYLDDSEQPTTAAVREVEEETGWHLHDVAELVRFQPMVGTADALNVVFLARADRPTGQGPDVNEAADIGWIPLDDVPGKIAAGEIVGAASIIGLQQVLLGARPQPS